MISTNGKQNWIRGNTTMLELIFSLDWRDTQGDVGCDSSGESDDRVKGNPEHRVKGSGWPETTRRFKESSPSTSDCDLNVEQLLQDATALNKPWSTWLLASSERPSPSTEHRWEWLSGKPAWL